MQRPFVLSSPAPLLSSASLNNVGFLKKLNINKSHCTLLEIFHNTGGKKDASNYTSNANNKEITPV